MALIPDNRLRFLPSSMPEQERFKYLSGPKCPLCGNRKTGPALIAWRFTPAGQSKKIGGYLFLCGKCGHSFRLAPDAYPNTKHCHVEGDFLLVDRAVSGQARKPRVLGEKSSLRGLTPDETNQFFDDLVSDACEKGGKA